MRLQNVMVLLRKYFITSTTTTLQVHGHHQTLRDSFIRLYCQLGPLDAPTANRRRSDQTHVAVCISVFRRRCHI